MSRSKTSSSSTIMSSFRTAGDGQTVYLKSDGPEVTGEIFEVRRSAAPSMIARSALHLVRLIAAVRLAAADGRADGPCWLETWREAFGDGYA